MWLSSSHCFNSLEKAISFALENHFDGYVAVGGGSVMDSAKAVNLMSSHPDKQLLDFVHPPIGQGQLPSQQLKPLICGRYKELAWPERLMSLCSFSAHHCWHWQWSHRSMCVWPWGDRQDRYMQTTDNFQGVYISQVQAQIIMTAYSLLVLPNINEIHAPWKLPAIVSAVACPSIRL